LRFLLVSFCFSLSIIKRKMVYIMFRCFHYVKQNVMRSMFYALMDTVAAILLYFVFPIIPIYVFILLLIMVLTASILTRYGLSSAILITYVILIFIVSLGHASLLIMPLLLLTYLITEAGVITDVALISWTLLFTPLYWLSIPLSTIPSIKGYSIRSAVVFTLLLLLYVIAAAFMGIKWVPVIRVSISNLNFIHGIESMLSNEPLSLSVGYGNLINASLYLLMIIVIVIPPVVSKYLTTTITQVNLSGKIIRLLTNFIPPVLTTAILYVLPMIGSSEITPLFLLGSVITGSIGYVIDEVSLNRGSIASFIDKGKRTPTIIPITDPLVITEYGHWAKKLPSEDLEFISNAIDVISKSRVIALRAELPQDKLDIISRVLFGVTRTKGFIVKGDDIEYIPEDVRWFVRSHEKSLLVLTSSHISKGVIRELINYAEQMKSNVIFININNNLVNKLRKYGIETLYYYDKSEQLNQQLKQINENVAQSTLGNNAITTIEDVTRPNSQVDIKSPSPRPIISDNSNEVVNKNTDNVIIRSVVPNVNDTMEEHTTKQAPKKQPSTIEVESKRSGVDKHVVREVTVALDPIDLINMSVKSKLIDYLDSSIRLRDMLANLGLRYMSTILVIGPPRSGKTALINYVAKHLNLQIINYADPKAFIADNAIIHVPNLENALNENLDHIHNLVNNARAKRITVVFESSSPWLIDESFVKGNVDAVVAVLPPDDDYIDEIVNNKLGISGEDADIIKAIIKSCPAVEAIEKIRHYLSSHGALGVICSDSFSKYREFAKTLSFT